MKTAEQFLEECKARWKEKDPRMQSEEGAKQALIEALILYAEQAIDACAEKLYVFVDPYTGTNKYYVNKETMLELKKQLK